MKIIAEILSIVILLAGMASCAKTDRIYDDTKTEIAMKPVMHTPTKAIVEGTTYPTGVNFGVLAYYSSAYGDQDKWTDLTGENAPVPYLDNQKFVTQGDGTFGGYDPCYWPHQGSLVFAGYSPYDSGTPSFNCSTKTLTITGFVSNGQTDLMYFLPEVSDDKLVGLNSGASSVPAAFSHALSLVEFNVKGVDNDETVKLKGITFKGIPHMGTLTADASGCSWDEDDLSSYDDLQVFSSDEGEVLSSETPVTATSLVIPGTAVNIELAYDAVGVTSHPTKTGTITPENAVTEWVAGKKYIYNLTIRSGFIVIESVTTSYIYEDESGIEI
ncbi:MAG: fimbrillin family protein [Bacteroidales bacterium]|nr:fimbrillin family protein [Bacteroidales bacterium]